MTPATTPQLDVTTRYSLVILAVVQGYALYFLHLAITSEAWPATELPWLKAFYTVAIGVPAFLYLSVDRVQEKRHAVTALVLALLLFFLGWHLGWVESVKNLPQHMQHELTPPLVFSLSVVLFILSFFYRSWRADSRGWFDYQTLLDNSWQQALTLGLLGLFVGAFWLLLFLCAGLFNAIGIDFFEELFEEPAFIYPITWLVLGLGLVVIRNRIGLIVTVEYMCEALIKALQPLAALIVILFLATLPFTGLQPVWDTGSAALLMIGPTLVMLFFFNAVLSRVADEAPYPLPVRLFVFAAIFVAPAMVLIAVWALWLRIDQYGLTPDRLWAAVILLITAGFTFSYSALIGWKRLDALRPIRQANIWLALGLVTVLLVINTPLADLRALSAHSQAERLLDGEVAVDEFDYAYMRFALGAYGVRALDRIAASQLAQKNPEVGERVAAAMKQQHRWSREPVIDTSDLAAVAARLRIVPADAELPRALLQLLVDKQSRCFSASTDCTARAIPPSLGGAAWLVFHHNDRGCANGEAYVQYGQNWRIMGHLQHTGCCKGLDESPDPITRIPGPFLGYTIGSCTFSIVPAEDYLNSLATQGSKPEEQLPE